MSLHARALPMFPLGSVLFPNGVLPLHVFEPRYRALVDHIMATDRCFGVVLISRGSEVGGGETRTAIGTVAEVREHELLDDGRSALIATGTTRFEVAAWLPDDPYPQAQVIDLAELEWTAADSSALASARHALDALLVTAHQKGRIAEVPELTVSDDEATAAWQLMDISPIGPLDRQRLLESPAAEERLTKLTGLLEALRGDLEQASDLDP